MASTASFSVAHEMNISSRLTDLQNPYARDFKHLAEQYFYLGFIYI